MTRTLVRLLAAYQLPDRLGGVLHRVRADRLQFAVAHRGLEPLSAAVRQAAHWISQALLAIGLFVGGSVLLQARAGPHWREVPVLAAVGYLLALWLTWRLLRRGRQLGGRLGEEIAFGDVSTGAENDLQRATDLARHMVTHYGMSEALGLATYDEQPRSLFLGGASMPERRNCSERTAEVIDTEVRRLLDDARERVIVTLKEHRAQLEALAGLLLEKESVDRAMLDDVLSRTTPSSTAVVRTEAVPAA